MTTQRMRLRDLRVPWPTPTRDGLAMACPLCGLSERRFSGPPTVQREKLEAHIAKPHARCRPCGAIVGTHRMAHHRKTWHRFPTPPIPGLEHVA